MCIRYTRPGKGSIYREKQSGLKEKDMTLIMSSEMNKDLTGNRSFSL
jgi:hypothetical protein